MQLYRCHPYVQWKLPLDICRCYNVMIIRPDLHYWDKYIQLEMEEVSILQNDVVDKDSSHWSYSTLSQEITMHIKAEPEENPTSNKKSEIKDSPNVEKEPKLNVDINLKQVAEIDSLAEKEMQNCSLCKEKIPKEDKFSSGTSFDMDRDIYTRVYIHVCL
ncbi:unnamed protein product [Mytilus coruscus]|uniref:Uncharacterized protein n=1 Tax=Mytilus coruscus TaxID=42192 RepID=A0A6J8EIN3_MYTCO|nr:unnamed protein product [Mytilus coruscus]